jgi:hypothetical protein
MPVRVAPTAVRRRLLRVAALVVASMLPLAGCGLTHLNELNFRVDNRLHFLAPKDRAKVHAPVTLSWTIRGFRVAPLGSEPASHDAGYFAVFVDRQPIQPGQTMKAVASGDRFCKRDPKCPDTSYLNDRGVYTTTASSIRLDTIANLNGNNDKVQLHTFVIVLMDTAGHRIGESAWERDLRLPRTGL